MVLLIGKLTKVQRYCSNPRSIGEFAIQCNQANQGNLRYAYNLVTSAWMSLRKLPVIFVDLNLNWNDSPYFSKTSQHQYSRQSSVGVELLHTDGLTNMTHGPPFIYSWLYQMIIVSFNCFSSYRPTCLSKLQNTIREHLAFMLITFNTALDFRPLIYMVETDHDVS